jgi:hypothetical protein
MPGCRLRPSQWTALAWLSVAVSATATDAPCVSSKLTRVEAQQLVMQVPEVLAIEGGGGKVEALEWNPAGAYGGSNSFFYYFALQRPKLETLPLQSGLVGHFAVNVYSARVVRLDTNTSTEADNPALLKLQTQLRSKHCISAQLVQENAEISP